VRENSLRSRRGAMRLTSKYNQSVRASVRWEPVAHVHHICVLIQKTVNGSTGTACMVLAEVQHDFSHGRKCDALVARHGGCWRLTPTVFGWLLWVRRWT
jgi:hypothetical protein